jgi:hypothetical protein
MEEQSENQIAEQENALSFFTKVGLVFTNPTRLFQSLRQRPEWILPVIVIIIISMISTFLISDLVMDSRIELLEMNDQLTDQQREMQIEGTKKFFGSTTGKIVTATVFPIIGTFLVVLVVGVAFLFTGNVVLGGSSTFKHMLAVASWGYLVSIVESVIKIPLMLAKGSIHVYTSLAVLFDTSEFNTVLFKIADAFDVFVIWRVIVWAIGFGIMYKFSKNKSLMAVIVLAVIYFAISIGLGSLFS